MHEADVAHSCSLEGRTSPGTAEATPRITRKIYGVLLSKSLL